MHTENKGSMPSILYGTLPVDGLSIAYREAGNPGSPKLVLLHGFPASSHQYRNLIPALASRFHVISPDYLGFRIVSRHPEALEWLIVQNTNAYEVGFTEAWGGLRNALWKRRTAETEQGVAGLLEFDTIRAVYLHGHKRPELISPDNWNMDFRFMERPNARRAQMDLFYDYRTNVELYPQWQNFLRK